MNNIDINKSDSTKGETYLLPVHYYDINKKKTNHVPLRNPKRSTCSSSPSTKALKQSPISNNLNPKMTTSLANNSIHCNPNNEKNIFPGSGAGCIVGSGNCITSDVSNKILGEDPQRGNKMTEDPRKHCPAGTGGGGTTIVSQAQASAIITSTTGGSDTSTMIVNNCNHAAIKIRTPANNNSSSTVASSSKQNYNHNHHNSKRKWFRKNSNTFKWKLLSFVSILVCLLLIIFYGLQVSSKTLQKS